MIAAFELVFQGAAPFEPSGREHQRHVDLEPHHLFDLLFFSTGGGSRESWQEIADIFAWEAGVDCSVWFGRAGAPPLASLLFHVQPKESWLLQIAKRTVLTNRGRRCSRSAEMGEDSNRGLDYLVAPWRASNDGRRRGRVASI